MHSLLLLLLISSACSGYFTPPRLLIPQEDGVLLLNVHNFHIAVAEYPFLMVEFYTSWCGICKTFVPEYLKAAAQLSSMSSPIRLAKIDATKAYDLVELYDVRDYPTLKFFRNGTAFEYEKELTAKGIVSWTLKKIQPAAERLNTLEHFEAFLLDNPIAVFGFFNLTNSSAAKEFVATANMMDSYAFATCNIPALHERYNVTDGAILLFKPYDDQMVEYRGNVTLDKLQKFIEIYTLPLIIDFHPKAANLIFNGPIQTHLLFFVSQRARQNELHVEPLRSLARDYRGRIAFVTISCDKEENLHLFEYFGITKSDVPTVRLINLNENITKYKFSHVNFSIKAINEFLRNYTEGTLIPQVISEDLPADWDAKHLKVLVGHNFKDVVFHQGKHVFVLFYAPWCRLCKLVTPIFEVLAEKYKDHENILIAKIDATANELEEPVGSFPTFRLYRKGDNKILEYNGKRSLEAFSMFLGMVCKDEKTTDAGGDKLQKEEL